MQRLLLTALLALPALTLTAAAPKTLASCNVVWKTPSKDASGSMPLGNGEVGLNLWVEENGDLLFTVARTDAWSEACRLLKLGRVRVKLAPNPFTAGAPFQQALKLQDGAVEVRAGAKGSELRLKVFVDAHRPVIHVAGTSQAPVQVTAALESWRMERRRLMDGELASSWTMKDAPASVEVWESADILPERPGAAILYHRNESSVVPLTLKHQGLESVAHLAPELLADRTFGLWMTAPGFAKEGAASLRSAAQTRSFEVRIVAHTAQTKTAEAWLEQAGRLSRTAPDAARAARETAAWWKRFWDRSWIVASGKEDANRVTQAYQLQRWMTACQARGAFPIKFNGGLFTTEPRFVNGKTYNPDYRQWGDCFWYQNTRHMYIPMPMAGDTEGMDAFFRLYERARPLAEARSRAWYGAEGAYFPETMTVFGAYGNGDYGWDRKGHTPGEVLCPWWCHAWNQGPELVMAMLDRYEWTGDVAFARERLLPMTASVLRWFDTRFKKDAKGLLVLDPTQSVETYWTGVVNDTPTVAGLRAVTARLNALPEGIGTAEQRALFRRMEAACPPIPFETRTIDGKPVRVVAPAEKYDPKRSNCENPELYPAWPFRLHGVGRPDLEAARNAYRHRFDHTENGWGYDGIAAATLGLTDEAARILLGKVANASPKYRFPAMWGPNFDWLPDQNHGGSMMSIAQTMLLQPVGEKLYVLPAWPSTWNVHFKLHAPDSTTVECVYRNGRIEKLDVQPKRRIKDVVVMGTTRKRSGAASSATTTTPAGRPGSRPRQRAAPSTTGPGNRPGCGRTGPARPIPMQTL